MGKTGAKRKKWPVVLLVILLLIGALTGFICWNASKNMKEMYRTLGDGLDTLSEYCKVTPADAGEYSEIRLYGVLKFHVSQYDLSYPDDRYFGNLSVMRVNMGFMQMLSFVITPYGADMPLLSMDYMYPLAKRKAYTEFYDLVRFRDDPAYEESILEPLRAFAGRYSSMEDVQTGSYWYDDLLTVALHKAGRRADDETVNRMFCDAIRTYMETAASAASLDSVQMLLDDTGKAEKRQLIQEYSDNLIKNGGVSTDVFKKQLGEEKTKDFFDKVFFGAGAEPALAMT